MSETVTQQPPAVKRLYRHEGASSDCLRNMILGAFEEAEAEEDPSRHRDLLTVVLVGAGPTGSR